jgi:hypothetical protein
MVSVPSERYGMTVEIDSNPDALKPLIQQVLLEKISKSKEKRCILEAK